MNKAVLLMLLVFMSGCRHPTHHPPAPRNRDTMISRYFQLMASRPFSDTLNINMRLLRAYHNNDTNYIKQAYTNLAYEVEWAKRREGSGLEGAPIMPLSRLDFDEAYRFSYEKAFCSKAVTLTIGKRADSVILDLYVFEGFWGDTTHKVASHTIKQLNGEDWNDLLKGIRHADFWGLKEENGVIGTDGSSLTVMGYQRPVPRSPDQGKYHAVYRWMAETTAIGMLFKQFLDRSGVQVDCYIYYGWGD